MSANKDALRFILGLKVKQLRDAKGLSLKNLSNLSGLSQSYINEIEKGKKYPKVEKLLSLAKSLGVSFDNLVSAQLDNQLRPILDFLESDLYKNLPLEMFGIDQYDLYELMSGAPEKFSSFILMLLSLARNYDLNLEEIHRAALRSFIEAHDGYIEEIELAVQQAKIRYNLPQTRPATIDQLKNILTEEYNYSISFGQTGTCDQTKDIRSIYTYNGRPILLINEKLNPWQQIFVITKEFAYCALNLNQNSTESRVDGVRESFKDVLNDFKANYFAGAILLNEDSFLNVMRDFFSKDRYYTVDIERILAEYKIGPETFFHRLTQLLPKHFGMDKLFFLRFDTTHEFKGTRRYKISKEIHLNGPHGPQGIRLNEHYCRRWITLSLLDQFCNDDNPSDYKLGIQKSRMLESGKEFLCFSVASRSNLNEDGNSCITLGLELNEETKKVIGFHEDSAIVTKEVSKTCERCPVEDCSDRVAPPRIYNRIQDKAIKNENIKSLIKDVRENRSLT